MRSAPPHDDRQGHHYYIRIPRPVKPSCIVVMTLAVIMLRQNPTPTLGENSKQAITIILCYTDYNLSINRRSILYEF